MRALWLAQVLRGAGLTVHEVSGWKTRGKDTWGPVRGITCHHTAGSRNSTVEGEIRVLLEGSTSAPPPIAQLFLARNGDWHVVASGACNHNKVGWGGPNEGYGNDALLGIEAQHSGGSEPWTDQQYRSYVRGVAALVRHEASGWNVTVSRVAGHKEHQPGAKTDPTFSMPQFRTDVAAMVRILEGAEMRKVPFQYFNAHLPVIPYGHNDADGIVGTDGERDGTTYVRRAQRLLQIDADGDYGPQTKAAIAALDIPGRDGSKIDLEVWERLMALWGAVLTSTK